MYNERKVFLILYLKNYFEVVFVLILNNIWNNIGVKIVIYDLIWYITIHIYQCTIRLLKSLLLNEIEADDENVRKLDIARLQRGCQKSKIYIFHEKRLQKLSILWLDKRKSAPSSGQHLSYNYDTFPRKISVDYEYV